MERGDANNAGIESGGWGQIEESMISTTLEPVPPTSDPERLLRYVLQIQPKYAEMEMLSTHLRLYATSLEQDLEQARNHSRILSTEVSSERDKKQFLERYAAQIVKERNEMLHTRSSKKAKASMSSHFTWHSCCKKSGEHSSDFMPSMAAFRGEKLQEAVKLMKTLQDEVRNQERLRQEVNFMLKRTHREHDSKSASDRKHIQQLERQLVQRAMLQSTMERKLYEVESVLARYDAVKDQEMASLEKELEEANARVNMLESQCERNRSHQEDLDVERDDLQDRLTHVMILKDELADQVEHLTAELAHAQAEIESLRGEVEVLQSEDLASVKTIYVRKMEKLQEEWAIREHDLMSQVDTLRQELRTDNALQQRMCVQDRYEDVHEQGTNTSRGGSHSSWTRQRDEWLRGSAIHHDGEEEDAHVGSSLSRSQLSHSVYSDQSEDEFIPDGSCELLKSQHQLKPSSPRARDDDGSLSNGGSDHSNNRLAVEAQCDRSGHSYTAKPGEKTNWSFARSSRSTKQNDSDVSSPVLTKSRRSSRRSHDLLDELFENKGDASADTSGNLLAEMQEMFKRFQDRRIEEERKAQEAEQALVDYCHERDEFTNLLAPVA